MKIYTRKGDKGVTSLASGERVPKHHQRVDLYGRVDELNAAIGVGIAQLRLQKQAEAATERLSRLIEWLESEQSLLFELGSELAGWREESILDADCLRLESEIDEMEEELPKLKSFILPGGTPAAAHLQLARTICRNLEREISRAAGSSDYRPDPNILRYTNRLSDYLFVAARYSNLLAGNDEQIWQSRRKLNSPA